MAKQNDRSERTVVVTGAGSGLGRAIAAAFGATGARLWISDISASRVEEARAELGANYETQTGVFDVSDFNAVDDFASRAQEDTGRIDVWVNNAGIFDGYAGIAETTPDLWRRIIDINLTGSFYGCKAASTRMGEGGRIINISSIASLRGSADGLAYTASKTGLIGMTRRLAIDLGPAGITVNSICPGTFPTDIRTNSAEILGPDTVAMNRGIGVSPDLMKWLIPVGRKGRLEEVASLAVYLAQPDAGYITGQAIYIDGGWSAT